MPQTYYDILGVSPNSTSAEIEAAFRILIKKYHPDHAPIDKEQEYTSIAKSINEARNILVNNNSRQKYDETIAQKVDNENYQKDMTAPNTTSHMNTQPVVTNMKPEVNSWSNNDYFGKRIKNLNFFGLGSFASLFIIFISSIFCYAIIAEIFNIYQWFMNT